MKRILLGIVCPIALFFAMGGNAAQAGLIGVTVNAAYFHPNLATSIGSQSFLVGAGVELSCPSAQALCGVFDAPPQTLDFTDNQIIFTEGPFTPPASGNYDGAPYNGFVFTNLNMGSPITGFSLSTTGFTGLTNSVISFTANSLNVNLSGVLFSNTDSFTITLQTSAVPEPSSTLLFGLGLASLAGLIYWHRRKA